MNGITFLILGILFALLVLNTYGKLDNIREKTIKQILTTAIVVTAVTSAIVIF